MGIYVCGATVQAPPHVGHIRSGLSFDILRRWLMASSFDVTYIRNVTVRFDHHNYLRPGGITVTDATGRQIDTFKLAGYRLETVGSSPARSAA